MTDRQYYYVENDEREFLCKLDDGSIGWSIHIIDAEDFQSEEEAEKLCQELGILSRWIGWRSGPPQNFLYENPYLPPKEKRIRLATESHEDFARRLGLLHP